MTYCIGILLRDGFVLASDSRTNAGVDNFASFCKMTVFERSGDRVIVLLSSGSLAGTQAVVGLLKRRNDLSDGTQNLWTAHTMFDVMLVVSDAVRDVERRDAPFLEGGAVSFNASFIVAGQIKGESPRLFRTYSEGNFIEATDDTPYFQIGESKYGKPIIDRVIKPSTPVDEALKCALVSFDSTMRSNLSVGLPLDMVVYEANTYCTDKVVCIDENNPYFKMLHNSWGQKLREVFDSIEDPMWSGGPTEVPLRLHSERHLPLKKISTPEEKLI
jgi:putative proteasome-type protease